MTFANIKMDVTFSHIRFHFYWYYHTLHIENIFSDYSHVSVYKCKLFTKIGSITREQHQEAPVFHKGNRCKLLLTHCIANLQFQLRGTNMRNVAANQRFGESLSRGWGEVAEIVGEKLKPVSSWALLRVGRSTVLYFLYLGCSFGSIVQILTIPR